MSANRSMLTAFYYSQVLFCFFLCNFDSYTTKVIHTRILLTKFHRQDTKYVSVEPLKRFCCFFHFILNVERWLLRKSIVLDLMI